jgi:hypothetical protein
MSLDLRVPLGLLFAIVGAMLAVFGAMTHGGAIYQRLAGLDINLIWGVVMLVFGVGMFMLGRRGGKLRALPGDGTGKPHDRQARG